VDEGQSGASEASNDHLEAEVTNLRQLRDAGAASEAEPARSPLEPRLSPRQRGARIVTAIAAVTLALVVVLGSFASVRDRLALLVFGPTPTPTATLEPGATLFYIVPGPPWAVISLDGHTLARLPTVGVDPPLRLGRGRHQIIWRADPFQPVRCVISVPIAGTDTCPYDRIFVNTPGQRGGDYWAITFYPSLATLPESRQAALTASAQAALDAVSSTDTVRPGELYLDVQALPPGPPEVTATQPLRATLSFQVLTVPSPNACSFDVNRGCELLGQDCHTFCTLPESGPPSGYWSVLALARAYWTYATLDGRIVAADQPDGPYSLDRVLPLHIAWDGAQWHAMVLSSIPTQAYNSDTQPNSPPLDDPRCTWMEEEIGGRGFPTATDPNYVALNWQFAVGPLPAAGCLGVGTPQLGTSLPGTPSPTLPPVYWLQRFGVTLAANDLARRLWPTLPAADAYEQSLARQLAQQLGH
jgi:hypothetical protein